MQVMDPRFFCLLNYGLRDGTRSVPYSMDLELSPKELHCIIHVTRTPDCVDKDLFTFKQFLPLLLLLLLFFFFHLLNAVG